MPRDFLIVDDSVVIQKTLAKMLERLGADRQRILTASDSEEALDLFRKEHPEVVLLDIQLPDVDGEQTAQVMFTEEPETKIVIITGLMEDDERVREMLAMGAFDLLQKPIHSSDVKELLRLLEEEAGGGGRIR